MPIVRDNAMQSIFAAAQSVTPTQPGSKTPAAQQNHGTSKEMNRDSKSDRSGMTTGSSATRTAPNAGAAGAGNNGNSMGGSNSAANPSNSAGSGSGSAGMR